MSQNVCYILNIGTLLVYFYSNIGIDKVVCLIIDTVVYLSVQKTRMKADKNGQRMDWKVYYEKMLFSKITKVNDNNEMRKSGPGAPYLCQLVFGSF